MITLNCVPKHPLQLQQRGVISGTVDANYAGEEVRLALPNTPVIHAGKVANDGSWQVQVAFQQSGPQVVQIAIGPERAKVALEVLGMPGDSAAGAVAQAVAVGQSASGQSASGQSASGQSASGQSASGQSASGQSASGQFASARPASGQPSGGGHRPSAPPPAYAPAVVSSLPSHQPTLASLVKEAHTRGYSDLHLGVGHLPHFRDRGMMVATPYPTTDDVTFYSWLTEILPKEDIEEFRRGWDYDGAAEYEFVRVRVNLMMTLKGPSMVLRLIPTTVPTLDELKFPKIFYDICYRQQGLVLITGPTGSGKSTTLAAMVHEINKNLQRHIITIEDPIEFVHAQDLKSVVSQREVGIHTREFARALKASLREDPDVILIGEIRDQETIRTALKAAQTGHLVFGTLHTNSAVKSLERIFNLFEPSERDTLRIEIAESLAAVISQALVRTTDGRRTALYEVLINTDTIRDYIKRDEPDEIEEQIKHGAYYGMCSRNQTIYKFYETGAISEETALEASLKPSEMAILLRGGEI